VTQMINKREGIFQDEDKQLLKAFAAFASKSLSSYLITFYFLASNTLSRISTQKISRVEGDIESEMFEYYMPSDEDKKAVTQWSFDVWKYQGKYSQTIFLTF
jgi:hypothetical protein